MTAKEILKQNIVEICWKIYNKLNGDANER